MELHPITTSKLPLLEASQFINRHLTGIRGLDGMASFTDETVDYYLSMLDARLEAFDHALMPVRKSNNTIKIEEQDDKRDQALSFLQRGAAMYEISDIAEEQDAARSLKNLFSTYKNLATLNYEAESRGIDHLLNDLGSSKYEQDVALLGLERCITRLQESNNTFKTLFGGRSEETIKKETFDAQSLKKEMLAVYTDFAEYVLAMAKPPHNSPLYTDMLSVLNATRKYFAGLLARRKGVAAEAV